ncbi:MAG: hypothetical protein JETT_1070 [Candidatus Jettenia ecosi]|uniref:Uncharacterized protein n=1 Tax=Candidatus Jettenia ecosi TaxID=2494326 RepID=A0A533QCZ2_9BACT|nr:MAG: hypothetical protein JETT_1070 [Candidatus Jettenia ecosi]
MRIDLDISIISCKHNNIRRLKSIQKLFERELILKSSQ